MNRVAHIRLYGIGVLSILMSIVAGCSLDIAEPFSDPLVDLETGGAILTEVGGTHRFEFEAGEIVLYGPTGLEVDRLQASAVAPLQEGASRYLPGLFGNGIDLRITQTEGLLRHVILFQYLPDFVDEAKTLEFIEPLSFDEDLRVFTRAGEVFAGESAITANGISLHDSGGAEVFYIPAATAWDARFLHRPWIEYELRFLEAGRAELVTRLSTSWFTEPGVQYPLALDPTVSDGAPPPIIATLMVTPTVPGANEVMLSMTYGNFYNDSMLVTVDWGDGEAPLERISNTPVYEIHDYPCLLDGGVVTIDIQISDFYVDPDTGEPAPRTVREIVEVLVGPSDNPEDCGAVDCFPDLPQPRVGTTGTEDFVEDGIVYTRYFMKVVNWDVIPDVLFAAGPGYPPCEDGGLSLSSRTLVTLFDQEGAELNVFCDLEDNEDLNSLWYAYPRDLEPPYQVYLELYDQACDLTYQSNWWHMQYMTPEIARPLPGTVLMGRDVLFEWTDVPSVVGFEFEVLDENCEEVFFHSGYQRDYSVLATGLPADGQKLYAGLRTFYDDGTFSYSLFDYFAWTASP
ncbi:MAG: hypothetical protein QGH30_02005 [Candidatus Krumholzibacteria bacterium]|nr:hypothetical protein [Candidatus Krumholzibacteria bacterium]